MCKHENVGCEYEGHSTAAVKPSFSAVFSNVVAALRPCSMVDAPREWYASAAMLDGAAPPAVVPPLCKCSSRSTQLWSGWMANPPPHPYIL